MAHDRPGRQDRRGNAREREGVAADYVLPADVMLKRPQWKTGCIRVPWAAIAQLGERQTEDLKVPGSIPGLGTLGREPICDYRAAL